jgi:transcriptional regulator with XRE-family HTH domain
MMTSTDFQAALDRLRLSQAEIARELELSDRTVRRYLRGEEKIKRPVELAMLYLIEHRNPATPSAAVQVAAGPLVDEGPGAAAVGAVIAPARAPMPIEPTPLLGPAREPRKSSSVLERMKTIPISRGR